MCVSGGALLGKLQNILPRSALLTIYNRFVRTHLDYGDIIYDQAFNNSFHQKIESLQYNAALAITGVIRGTSRRKNYEELGLESLQQRHWYRKLCLFFKVYKNQCPRYLFDIIPQSNCQYRTRNEHFPSTIIESNKLDSNIRNSETLNIFKSTVSINFIISSSTTEYILTTKRFDEPLFLFFVKFLITYLVHVYVDGRKLRLMLHFRNDEKPYPYEKFRWEETPAYVAFYKR